MVTDTDRRHSALVVASAGYFFVLLDVTIVNVALARIGSDLGASRAELQWVVDDNTSRQVGGAVGVALIGGFTTVGASLLASGVSLALGGATALALMKRRVSSVDPAREGSSLETRESPGG